MKPRLWKIIIYWVLAIAGMVVPFQGFRLLGLLGPPPYLLHDDRLGPEWSQAQTFPDGSTVHVHTYANAAAAKEGAKALATAIPQSSTTKTLDVVRYTRRDNRTRGLLVPSDNRVLQIEAGDDQAVDETLTSLPFVSENPEKNLARVVLNNYLGIIFVAVALYVVLWFYFLFRGATWAAGIPPPASVTPVPAETLRTRLLAINDLNLPFLVREEPCGRLVAEWRIADANWVGMLQASGLRMAHQVYLELDPGAHKVRVLERHRTITWCGDIPRVGWFWSFLQGISFYDYKRSIKGVLARFLYKRGIEVGLFFKDGQWATTAYDYRFNVTEMKNPLIQAIVGSGWTFAPVVTFFRLLGGREPACIRA
jgi:hypothetical protein